MLETLDAPARDTHGSIGFTRDGGMFVLHARQWLPRKPAEVYAFMSDCRHMNLVLPQWVRLHVVNDKPAKLAAGVTYDYRFTLHGLPMRWRTRITDCDAPHAFVDEQARGPYASFRHEHRFVPLDGGTVVHDTIRYRPPGGPLAPLINSAWVRRDLRNLFTVRHRRLIDLYASHEDPVALLGAPL